MNFEIQRRDFNTLATDCLIIGVNNLEKVSSSFADQADQIQELAELSGFEAKPGQVLALPNFSKNLTRVFLLGVSENASQSELTGSLKSLAKSLLAMPITQIAIDLDSFASLYQGKAKLAGLVVQPFIHSLYQYDQFKSKKAEPKALSELVLLSSEPDTLSQEQRFAKGLRAGATLTRDLGNAPGNVCYPQFLLNLAQSLAAEFSDLDISALGESQMQAMGFGSFLSVSKGSEKEGKLICMNYHPENARNKQPIALVGKGITFDSGGISLKPGARMDEMKYDMCGAATVFGLMKAICVLELPLHVVGVIAAAENMPGGGATRPGDIVTSLSGKTIEILNTDAEGRLVLCDALTYTQRVYDPELMIDFATLTGACVVALGDQASGLYSKDEALSDALVTAGEHSYDRAWPMPLFEEYSKQLESPFADLQNIGGPKAGSVTAACFLAEFVDEDRAWAHFDIAGTAWNDGAEKNASGRPVPLMLRFLLEKADA
ncbi:MAG: leucyl aminopeptidase [Pseudomonadota bacterium]|nr:leucyl aminopeptidase [Pseudomonadota bacterium]